MPHRQQKSRARELSLLGSNSFIWVFLATILRPLTCAKSYATIADRKSANSEGMTHTKVHSAAYCKSEKKIPSQSQNSLPLTNKFDWVSFGGDNETRTRDLYVANVSRYQLCYIPEVVEDGSSCRPSPRQTAAHARKHLDDTTFPAEKQAFFGCAKKIPLRPLRHF